MYHPEEVNSISLPGFVFDLAQRELREASGARVALRPQTQAVLICLARNVDHVVTKDALMQEVWPDVVVTDDSLVQCIGKLRRVLHDDEHRVIQTESRRGYRLVSNGRGADSGAASSAAEGWQFHQDIRFATTADGVRIAYATSGNGPPLVRAAHWMTHLDWDWRSATFGPRIQAFSRRFRLVRYDGRGYGLSDWQAPAGTLDDAVVDLESVVAAAGLERFALLGASGGAPIAICFAVRHPQRVSGLVLLGAFARGALRRGERSISRENWEALLRLIEDGWGQDNPAFRQLITTMMWPGADAQQTASFNHLQRVSCSPKTAVGLLRSIANFDVTDELAGVQCPTLVLHSPRDSRIPFEEGRLLASMIKGARLEPFDSPNHTPLVGEPAFEQVQNLIEAFLLDKSQSIDLIARQEAALSPLHVVGNERGGVVRLKAHYDGS
jgi:pimeloyl-ACP methyl ester carboxylesterase/DNA-binding winged helix-turn-helix (wHTH) protein